ncbi:DUF2971 domain-containing protein [Aeromonas veronii]|uniref:DUF2971 domain-containing protein n=1 Tax=Aeromonas veronii TaxID=654 RepID=UPI003D2569C0
MKDQVIYFGSPRNFNDPYDCALSPGIKEPTDADIEKIRRHYLNGRDLSEKIRREFELTPVSKLRNLILRIGQDALDQTIADFLSRRGVSCFSEKVDSLLMWSHYSDHCKGFCLEFDTSTALFDKIKKVRYEQAMPEIDIVPMLCDKDFDHVLELYCTKAIDWAYEHEWRGIHNAAGTAFCYESTALTGVYFGPDMSFSAIEIIALILAGQNEHVQLWQGRRSKSCFSVDFQRVTYTPYLEAKRMSLINDPGT